MPRDGTGDWRSGIDRRTFLKGAGASGTVLLAGCTKSGGGAGQGVEGNTIPIGHLSPFSGGLGWIGPNSRRARKLAKKQINEAGVVGGKKVKFNQADSETNPKAAVQAFKTLNQAGVQAVIGPSSTVMPNLVQPIKSNKLPVLTPMAGTVQLNPIGGEWIWRTVPSDTAGGKAQGKFAVEQGHDTMTLAFKNDKGSKSFSSVVGNYFKDNGGSVKKEVKLPKGASSYRSQVQTIQNSDPDVVSMTAATQVTSLFLQSWFNQGLGTEIPLLLSNDIATQDFVEKIGADRMENAKVFAQQPASGPAFDEFKKDFKEMHGKKPGAFAANSYDAANLIALAFQKEGKASRKAIPNHMYEIGNPPGEKVSTFPEGKKALEAGKKINYEGAGTPQNFNKNGDPLGAFSIIEVEDGSWTEVKTFSGSQLK